MLSHRAIAQSGRAGGRDPEPEVPSVTPGGGAPAGEYEPGGWAGGRPFRSVEGEMSWHPAPETSRRAASTPATPSWRRTPTPRIAASRAAAGLGPPRASPVPARGVAELVAACRDGRVVRGGQDGASTLSGLSPPAAGCTRGGRVHPARAERLARPLRREFPRPVDRLDAERCRWRCQHLLPLVEQLGPLAPAPSQH